MFRTRPAPGNWMKARSDISGLSVLRFVDRASRTSEHTVGYEEGTPMVRAAGRGYVRRHLVGTGNADISLHLGARSPRNRTSEPGDSDVRRVSQSCFLES